MKFIVKGEGAKVIIDIKCRNYPDSNDYWDGNWINSDIEASVPGYRVSFNGNLRAEELVFFLRSLKKMNQSLSGFSEFTSIEGVINIRGEINKTGQVEWTGKTTYPVGIGATLTFSFVSDQSFLPNLISELELVTKEFPVKGNPKD
jgi:hypothetical protein